MRNMMIVAVLLLGGCKKDKFEQALSDMGGLKDRMCGCADKACADKVNEDFHTFRKDMKEKCSKEEAKDIPKDKEKQAMELQDAYDKCREKFRDAPPPPAPATP